MTTIYDSFIADAIQMTGRITGTMFPKTLGGCSDEARASILAGVMISTATILASGRDFLTTRIVAPKRKEPSDRTPHRIPAAAFRIDGRAADKAAAEILAQGVPKAKLKAKLKAKAKAKLKRKHK